jgi:hypothetical protein
MDKWALLISQLFMYIHWRVHTWRRVGWWCSVWRSYLTENGNNHCWVGTIF